MFGPTIVGERVTLTPVTVEMLPNYVRWLADRDVVRFMDLLFSPTATMEQEWFDRISRSENDIVWAVMVDDRHVGTTGVHEINWRNRRAKTGNLIGDKSVWGKGYGSETVQLRTDYAFLHTSLEKLHTAVFMENAASRRCLEKAGYRQYGVARRHTFRDGHWHDMWLADILRDEWAALRE